MMECTQLENEKYKGVISMGKHKGDKESKLLFRILSFIAATIVMGLIGLLSWMCVQIYDINGNIKANNKVIENLETEVSSIKKDINKINDILNGDDGNKILSKRIEYIEERLNSKIIDASDEITNSVDEASIESNDTNLVTSPFESTTCIGTDTDGNTYVAEDLIGETILLTYTEGDEEVYFLGQYNENYNWDGYCVTNSYYSDGRLMGICESNFDNGKRLDYKSFVKDDAQWIYSDRICSDDSNVGMNETYILNYEKVKNFTNTNVRVTDILYVDKFIETNEPSLKELYHGDTTDSLNGDTVESLYNDDSGNAYYISFFDDGTVKTLYQGNFKDGKFNDNTGNAWYIVKDIDTDYMYFKGSFENNSPVGQTDDNTENPIDLARINEIIQGKNFDCELKWATS